MEIIKKVSVIVCLLGWCLSQKVLKPATVNDPFTVFELGPSETTDEWLKQIQGIQI